MNLKFMGKLVRTGIVVIGVGAVVLTVTNNFFLSKDDDMLIFPISSNIPVSESISEIIPENDQFSESTVISTNQGFMSSQSSSSVSTEIKTEPSESSYNSDNSEQATQQESYISEPSSTFQSSEDNELNVPPVSSSTVTSSDPENSSLETTPEAYTTISIEIIVSTDLTTTSNSSLSEPQSSSSIPEYSSTKPEPPESSTSTVTETTKLPDDTPILPEPDDPDIVNINTASVEELKTLRGLDDVKAKAIIAYRECYGDFVSIYDIRRVDGIGDIVFEGIRDYITV